MKQYVSYYVEAEYGPQPNNVPFELPLELHHRATYIEATDVDGAKVVLKDRHGDRNRLDESAPATPEELQSIHKMQDHKQVLSELKERGEPLAFVIKLSPAERADLLDKLKRQEEHDHT